MALTLVLDKNAGDDDRVRRNFQRLAEFFESGDAFVGAILDALSINETPSGTINGINATFTLANTPVAGTVMVWVSGLLMREGAGNDYTISGGTITFEAGAIPIVGDWVKTLSVTA